MLPFSISVDLKDIAAAKQAGASSADAPNRAFLKKLDETAERTFGADAWRNTSFVGNVMYKTKIMMMTGSSMITVSKPCGKSAEESGGTEDSFASTPRLAVVVVAALAVVAGSAAGSPVVAGASATVSRPARSRWSYRESATILRAPQ